MSLACAWRGINANTSRYLNQVLRIHPDDRPARLLLGRQELALGKWRDAEADQCYRRALAILERALGPNHPSTVACRENLDALLSGVQ